MNLSTLTARAVLFESVGIRHTAGVVDAERGLGLAQLAVCQAAGVRLQYRKDLTGWQSPTNYLTFNGDGWEYRVDPADTTDPEADRQTDYTHGGRLAATDDTALRDKLADAQRQLEAERAQYIAHENQIRELKRDLDDLRGQVAKLEAKRDELLGTLRVVKDTRDAARAAYEAVLAERDGLTAERYSARAALDRAIASRNRQAAKIQAARDALNRPLENFDNVTPTAAAPDAERAILNRVRNF